MRRIGEGAASSLFTTGERFDATEARRVGLVHRVVEGNAELDAAVDETVAAILAGGPGGGPRGEGAGAIDRGAPGGADAMANHTARLLAGRRASAEAAEGLDAFAEGRRPAWALGDKHPT